MFDMKLFSCLTFAVATSSTLGYLHSY